jgi:DNA-binding response OmpR family regulator
VRISHESVWRETRSGDVESDVPEGQSVTKHILVIDDRAHLLALLRMILEDERYQVSVLQEGRGAVEHIRESSPDLIILDLKLADASGMDILESLRAQESTADIPVIVYTAAVMEAEAVERVVASNPTRFTNVSVLQKPFELDTLLDRVGQLLGAREAS